MRDAHNVIARRATLVAISPQLAEHSRSILEEKHIPFPLLRDPGNRVAHEFGVRLTLSEELREAHRSVGLDLAIFNGDDTWTLPHPARFVIDGGGVDLLISPRGEAEARICPRRAGGQPTMSGSCCMPSVRSHWPASVMSIPAS